jgi:PPOX class probable F420-dependent enzyme
VNVATEDRINWEELIDFLHGRTKVVLLTRRADGRMQASPVTGAVDDAGHLLVSSYPSRAKVRNVRRDGRCAAVVLSDDFDGPGVQVYGTASVVEGEDGVERLVDYYRAAAGEHSDWDEYRQAMRDRGKVAIDVEVTDWGPIATGGVPPEFADQA